MEGKKILTDSPEVNSGQGGYSIQEPMPSVFKKRTIKPFRTSNS
jgi:hypothetical protein